MSTLETKLFNRLSLINYHRTNIIKKLYLLLPISLLEKRYILQILLLFTVSTTTISVLIQDSHSFLFLLHPILMLIGVVLFISNGVIMYRDGLFYELLSPIMESNKLVKIRTIHLIVNYVGLLFIYTSVAAILLSKIHNSNSVGHSNSVVSHSKYSSGTLVDRSDTRMDSFKSSYNITPRANTQSVSQNYNQNHNNNHSYSYNYSLTALIPTSIHSVLGVICIVILTIQVIVGQNKYNHLTMSNKKSARYHKELGLILWDLLVVTMITGMLSFLQYTFTNLLIVVTVVITWLSVHLQMFKSEVLGTDLINGHSLSDVNSNSTINSNSNLVELSGRKEHSSTVRDTRNTSSVFAISKDSSFAEIDTKEIEQNQDLLYQLEDGFSDD